MDNTKNQPAAKSGFIVTFLTIAGFSLALILLAFVWLDGSREPVVRNFRSSEERLEVLHDQREREQEELNSYGWINRDEEIVRLPVDRAMELVLEELNQKQN